MLNWKEIGQKKGYWDNTSYVKEIVDSIESKLSKKKFQINVKSIKLDSLTCVLNGKFINGDTGTFEIRIIQIENSKSGNVHIRGLISMSRNEKYIFEEKDFSSTASPITIVKWATKIVKG
jgi:hypothetical protein